jgi:transposase
MSLLDITPHVVMSAPTPPSTSTSPSAPTLPMITSPSVPELDEVRAWIEKMIKALRFVELVVAVLALIGRMRDINLDLVKQIVQFRRARPRSETLRRLEAQQAFAFMGEGSRPSKPKKAKQSRKGRHPGRAALPAHLPRVEVINAVPPDQRKCPVCGREMTTVGYEVGERLEAHPARLYVLACKSERVACPHDDTIVTAKVPPQIVERGKLGDTLIIDAVADKFLEHQPTERQSRRFSRDGVDLPPQTLGRSMAAGVDLYSVIAREIQRQTVASPLLGTDASGLPVLDQDHPLGIRNGTMWCWVGGQKWVTFFYARHGDAQSIRDFLGENVCRTV